MTHTDELLYNVDSAMHMRAEAWRREHGRFPKYVIIGFKSAPEGVRLAVDAGDDLADAKASARRMSDKGHEARVVLGETCTEPPEWGGAGDPVEMAVIDARGNRFDA